MEIFKTVSDIRQRIAVAKSSGKTIGFVPTMGALHEGHLSLVRDSKKKCGITVVSIFVNPTQFSPTEDLEKYPRPIENDIALLEKENTDILFLPSVKEIYPQGASSFVTVENITTVFEGELRPTHFKGVTTVVASLFNIVCPDLVFFGQKDLQQCAVIKKMVRDLHFPVEIVIGETIREGDGLAMSSRNRYLSSTQREESLILSKTLFFMKDELFKEKSMSEVRLSGAKYFNSLKKEALLEYLEIILPETFQLAESFKANEEIAIVIAAKMGNTRLIDNILVQRNS
jgi:pantoate--beta-alanine ligase